MVDSQPRIEERYIATDERPLTAWTDASQKLAAGSTYWLATTGSDGSPHIVPVLAVWVENTLHFVANRASQKARNLVNDPRCAIATGAPSLDLVVQGNASRVSDSSRLALVAGEFLTKYDWPVTVRDGAFFGDGAPTAGPPPYDVYEVVLTRAYGFGTDESHSATRWSFE
jgi:nitroimidazol reductase NimA-like FMN-containing flavoprotein (pyridoxamine 5'-phosphate oxidase superfamily)